MNNSWLINRTINTEKNNEDLSFTNELLKIHNLPVLESNNDILDILEKMNDDSNCLKKKIKNDDIFNREILSKLDDTDILPSNLKKIFEKYNMTSYFKIGVKKKLDSFFHSFMSIIDNTFYFNPIEKREFNINELKKKMLLDLSEKNFLRTFNYSRKHWNTETFRKEFDNQHIVTEKTINYFQNYFNINIIIYEFKLNNFWLSIDELFDYNRDYIVIIKYTDNDYEPVICQSWINFSTAKDSEFLNSIKDIQKHLGLNTTVQKTNTSQIESSNTDPTEENSLEETIDETENVEENVEQEEENDDEQDGNILQKIKDWKNYKKNYSASFFNSCLLSELHIIADAIDVDKSTVLKGKKIKNKLKPELIKDILNKEADKNIIKKLKNTLNEIFSKRTD